MECSKGEILRKKYTRKSFVRKDGTKVKKTTVPASCIKDRGNVGKGRNLLGRLKSGTLTNFGYSSKMNQEQRHSKLKKALKSLGYSTIVKKLNAVRILNKNTNPKISSKFHKDIIYLKKNYRKV